MFSPAGFKCKNIYLCVYIITFIFYDNAIRRVINYFKGVNGVIIHVEKYPPIDVAFFGSVLLWFILSKMIHVRTHRFGFTFKVASNCINGTKHCRVEV